MRRRISPASATFGRLKIPIWQKHEISKPLKVRLYKALIISIAMYAAETWTIKSKDSRKLEAFEMQCLRTIFGVKLCDRVSSENGLANEEYTNRHYQNQKAHVVWACAPKTRKQPRSPCVSPRRPKSKTTRPSPIEMVDPNPRGQRPTPGDIRMQSVRKARLAQRSHGKITVPESNTPTPSFIQILSCHFFMVYL